MVSSKKNSTKKFVIIVLLILLLIALILLIVLEPKSSNFGTSYLPEPARERLQTSPGDTIHPAMMTEKPADVIDNIDGINTDIILYVLNFAPVELSKHGVETALSTEIDDWKFSREVIDSVEYWIGETVDVQDRQVYTVWHGEFEEETFRAVFLKYDDNILFDQFPAAEPSDP